MKLLKKHPFLKICIILCFILTLFFSINSPVLAKHKRSSYQGDEVLIGKYSCRFLGNDVSSYISFKMSGESNDIDKLIHHRNATTEDCILLAEQIHELALSLNCSTNGLNIYYDMMGQPAEGREFHFVCHDNRNDLIEIIALMYEKFLKPTFLSSE